MAKKELPGIDVDTLDMIEKHVKKGKPRKFFVIYKGADIRSLVVFKKGPFGPKLMEAKKAGFLGDSFCGIIVGSGVKLTFMLAGNPEVAGVMKVDGWAEEAPLEEAKFRKFFLNNGTKFKPEFQVVVNPAELPGISEDDDDDSPGVVVSPSAPAVAVDSPEPPPAPPESQPTRTPAAATTSTDAAPPPTDEAAESASRRSDLLKRFAELKPRLSIAITAHADEADDLKDLAQEFGASIKINDLDVASEWLDKLAEALDELPDAAPTTSGGMAEFEAKLKQVAPVAIPIAKAGGERGDELMSLLKQAQAFRTSGDAAFGMAKLAEIDRLLDEPPDDQPAAPTAAPKEDPAATFRARLTLLIPQIKGAAGTATGDEAKRLAGQAGTAAQEEDFAQAHAFLDRAEQTLNSGTAAAESEAGDVLAIWREAKEAVDGQFNQLTGIFENSQHPYLRQVAELGLNGLAEDPSRVYVGMMTSLFDFQNAPSEQRASASAKVLDSAAKYKNFLDRSPVLEVFDTDPLCGPTTIRKTMSDALAAVERQVAATAS